MKVLVLVVLAVAALAIFTQMAFAQETESANGWARPFLEYEASKVDPWGPFVLNMVIPFGGIGSFVQGDTTGGMVVAGGQIAGITLVLAGSSQGYPTTTSYVGYAIAGVATLAGLVLPFAYASSFNEELREITVSSVALNEHGLNIDLTADLH
jgi:hypothetical protein